MTRLERILINPQDMGVVISPVSDVYIPEHKVCNAQRMCKKQEEPGNGKNHNIYRR